MALAVTHNKVATLPDDPAYEVGTTEWNDSHVLTQSGLTMLGNMGGLSGPTGEMTAADVKAFIGFDPAVYLVKDPGFGAQTLLNFRLDLDPTFTMRFQHANAASVDDGKIGVAMLGNEGLSIWGVQTVAAAGRKLHLHAATVNTSGHVGVGAVSPTGLEAGSFYLNVGPYANISTAPAAGNNYIQYNLNAVFDGTSARYIEAAAATQMHSTNGAFVFRRAAAGVAGAVITWSALATLNANGLGVGVAPLYSIHAKLDQNASTRVFVDNATSGTAATSLVRASYNNDAQIVQIVQRSPGFTPLGMRVANSGELSSSGNSNGLSVFTFDATPVRFGTNNAEAMQLSGNTLLYNNALSVQWKNAAGVATPVLTLYTDNNVYFDSYYGSLILRAGAAGVLGTAVTISNNAAITAASLSGSSFVDGAILRAGAYAGPPVLSGTIISRTAANTGAITFGDGPEGLTYNGSTISTTVPLTAAAFSPSGAAIPANGLYLPAAGKLGWTTGSTLRMDMNGTALTLYGLNIQRPIETSNLALFGGVGIGASLKLFGRTEATTPGAVVLACDDGVTTPNMTLSAALGTALWNGIKGMGYGVGAGGTVTQLTSKATAVALNRACGTLITHNASLAANTAVSFTWNNTSIGVNDRVIFNVLAGTAGAYRIDCIPAANSASVNIRNLTAGALAEAITIGFAIIKGVVT